jgi:isopenicillin-N N-acyltransferase-like protein
VFQVIETSGSARDRGRQHGLAASLKIRSNCEATSKILRVGDETEREAVRARRHALDFAVQRYAPDLWEEMEGIADGASIPLDDILTLNAWPDVIFGSACSTALVRDTATGEVLLWQNNDAFAAYARGMVVLTSVGEATSHTQFTYAGMVGESGMNSAGLAIAGNSLHTDYSGGGIPFIVMMRILLDSCATVPDVIEALKARPRAGGMNYAVADASGNAAHIETSAAAMSVAGVEDWAFHTNHCLAPEVAATEVRLAKADRENSEQRLLAGQDILSTDGDHTVELLMTIARSHGRGVGGICAHGTHECGRVQTLYSFVAAPETRRMWLASGSPCENEFEEVEPSWALDRPMSASGGRSERA